MEQKHERKWRGGFTLIELMAVIVIIGILAAIIVPNWIGAVEKGRRNAAKAQIRQFEGGLKMFKLDNAFYPSTEQGLEALISAPASGRIPSSYQKGGYMDGSKVPDDPWGNPYEYESPGSSGYDYQIVSLGADGLPGGEDENSDIESWNIE